MDGLRDLVGVVGVDQHRSLERQCATCKLAASTPNGEVVSRVAVQAPQATTNDTSGPSTRPRPLPAFNPSRYHARHPFARASLRHAIV